MTWKEPKERYCFNLCRSCWKCEDYDPKHKACRQCTYFRDNNGCDCPNAIVRSVGKKGNHIGIKLPHDPYGGKVTFVDENQDAEWEEYLEAERERRGDPHWNPIR